MFWEREEKYWSQRARVNWLTSGDANTSFFHKTTQQHRARNKIVRIKNDEGDWVEEIQGIGDCFSQFYRTLFSAGRERSFEDVLSYMDPIITEADNIFLLRPVTVEEIRQAAHELGGFKAPGPDGFPTGIRQGPSAVSLLRAFPGPLKLLAAVFVLLLLTSVLTSRKFVQCIVRNAENDNHPQPICSI